MGHGVLVVGEGVNASYKRGCRRCTTRVPFNVLPAGACEKLLWILWFPHVGYRTRAIECTLVPSTWSRPIYPSSNTRSAGQGEEDAGGVIE